MIYKKAIEELENHKQNISIRDCELLDAIDFAIGIMYEVEGANEVMPEKSTLDNDAITDNRATIHTTDIRNETIDQCTIIHAKVVGELKEKLKKYEEK